MENPSVLLYGALTAKVEDRPIPTISDPHDVIVQIAYTGVCGSDVHFWLHGGIRTFVSASAPLVMGHEACGTVHAVGSGVTTLQPGDRVAIEPGVPCRRCPRCKAGRYNLCSGMAFAADSNSLTHGTLTKYFKTSADFCYKIPDNLQMKEGVLLEPLAVAVHAVRLADVKPGQRVVVFGAGTVGLFCAAVAKEFGASVVVSIDLLQNKLNVAKELLGSDIGRTWMPNTSSTPEQNAEQLRTDHGLGDGADVVIDATGAEPSVQTAMYALSRGGTYVQAGMGKRKIEFPIAEVCERELSIKGCFRYGPGDFELAMSLVQRGRINLATLITGEFPFEKASEAWESTSRGEGIKNVIRGSA
ncbi:putative D-xylulose reductase A [Pestalotiopsis fici W106-1]|uniref:L-arabinitol 4-dehydrogenase n=1 Tax=Pestalotiopsis fici (strain W106-1 / CGMCC3.15140) TaxID=1229662 RepID=W3X9C7_PESFW|nr:putative D-xylulose reductase A [Pestalotiopsis fici W106-1]ETS82644.1 putative D-xylulose reductase A [Pestalotiopsis fici W106-1]